MSSFHQIEDVWKYLNKIPKFQDKGSDASNFELENISEFCGSIRNPQNNFPSIHVAGTNGKGTTCHLFEEVYRNGGYKTGLFTSPHLLSYNERFRINGEEINDETLLLFFQKYEELLEQIPLTYFEISTALAFWLFAHKNVDLAIIETGLGGRLDSTNIINPELSVITSIGFDHADVLGNTLEQIASEKAGIIKNQTPVVLGNIQEELIPVFEKKASEINDELYKSTELNPLWENGRVSFNNDFSFDFDLLESINKWNFASVFQGVKVLQKKFPVSQEILEATFSKFKGAPARFEKLVEDKDWFFSGAHNRQALESTAETIAKISNGREPVLILSIMKDKLNQEVAELVNPFNKLYYAETEGERAADFDSVKEYLPEAEIITENNHKNIMKEFETSLVIFTGSFYFYSTVKRWVS